MISREEKNKKIQNKIIKEEKREKRNKIIKKTLIVSSIIIVLLICFVLYSRYISTSGLVIREYPYYSNKLPDEFDGFKVIHFSDLHFGSTVDIDYLRNLVDKINSLKPDLIVWTGDLIDKDYTYSFEDKENIITEFKRLTATVGKYAVSGNHDYKDNSYRTIIESSDFVFLDNNYDLVYYKGQNPILITGISSFNKDKANIKQAFSYYNNEENDQDIFNLFLLHEPDTLDKVLTDYPVDLALAGHSHNGQVRLPYIGSIVKVKGARKYSEEQYRVNQTSLYVSGGVGTSGYKFRLFNKPSINFFRFIKQ